MVAEGMTFPSFTGAGSQFLAYFFTVQFCNVGHTEHHRERNDHGVCAAHLPSHRGLHQDYGRRYPGTVTYSRHYHPNVKYGFSGGPYLHFFSRVE